MVLPRNKPVGAFCCAEVRIVCSIGYEDILPIFCQKNIRSCHAKLLIRSFQFSEMMSFERMSASTGSDQQTTPPLTLQVASSVFIPCGERGECGTRCNCSVILHSSQTSSRHDIGLPAFEVLPCLPCAGWRDSRGWG